MVALGYVRQHGFTTEFDPYHLGWSTDTPEPITGTGSWDNNAELNLFNQAGLPASCFRTDEWKIEQEDNKE